MTVLPDRFAVAVERADLAALTVLLGNDVALETPPLTTWFSGRDPVLAELAASLCTAPGRIRLVPVAANGQPAFAAYRHDADGVYRAHAIIVLTVSAELIARIVVFLEPALFRLFGLERESRPGEPGRRGGAAAAPAGLTQANLGPDR